MQSDKREKAETHCACSITAVYCFKEARNALKIDYMRSVLHF